MKNMEKKTRKLMRSIGKQMKNGHSSRHLLERLDDVPALQHPRHALARARAPRVVAEARRVASTRWAEIHRPSHDV